MEDRSLLSACGALGSLVSRGDTVPALHGPATPQQGAAVAGATELSVRLPSSVPVGKPVMVSVTATDASGRIARGYSGTLNVTSSDASATLPASADIHFHRGVARFQVTFATAGTDTTLSVADSSTPPLSGTATTTAADPSVVTGYALHLPKNVPLGAPVTVQVAAVNALGRPVSTYTGPVTVTSSDSAAILPASGDVTFVNGVAKFQVTFKTAGANTGLTVSDGGSLTKTATTNVVDPAVVTRFALILPRHVQAGTPTTVRVAALNGLGSPVSNYTGPITLSSSDASAVLPTDAVTFTDGLARFQVTFNSKGKQTLTVADATDATLTNSATTNVNTWKFGGGMGRFRWMS